MTLVDGPNSPIDVGFTQFRPRVDNQIDLHSSDSWCRHRRSLDGRVVTPYTLPSGYRGLDPSLDRLAYTDVRTGEYDEIEVTEDTFQVELAVSSFRPSLRVCCGTTYVLREV